MCYKMQVYAHICLYLLIIFGHKQDKYTRLIKRCLYGYVVDIYVHLNKFKKKYVYL